MTCVHVHGLHGAVLLGLLLAGCRTRLPEPLPPPPLPCRTLTLAHTGDRTAVQPFAIAAGDWNGDRRDDLLVSGNGGAAMLAGNGNGTFGDPVHALASELLWYPLPVDVDGDGNLDAVLHNGTAHQLAADGAGSVVALGDGRGGLQRASLSTYGVGLNHALLTFQAVDLDGDSVPEIIGTSGVELVVFKIGPGATLLVHDTHAFQSDVVAVGDFDEDGRSDLVAATWEFRIPNGSASSISLLRGRGDGTFGSPEAWSTGTGYDLSVFAGDFDRDGSLDVAATNDRAVEVYFGDGHGGTLRRDTYPGLELQTFVVGVVDLDNDGLLDLLLLSDWQRKLLVMHGRAGGRFASPTTIDLGVHPYYQLAIGDWNGDHCPDLAIPVHGDSTPIPYQVVLVLSGR